MSLVDDEQSRAQVRYLRHETLWSTEFASDGAAFVFGLFDFGTRWYTKDCLSLPYQQEQTMILIDRSAVNSTKRRLADLKQTILLWYIHQVQLTGATWHG